MPEQPGRDASENLVDWRPQNQGPKTYNGFRGRQSGLPSSSSAREALHGKTGFAVFGPQNEGHKFCRKRNSSLDTSMAKPTPKHLSRMVVRLRFVAFCWSFVWFLTPITLKLCETQTGCRCRALQLRARAAPRRRRSGTAHCNRGPERYHAL